MDLLPLALNVPQACICTEEPAQQLAQLQLSTECAPTSAPMEAICQEPPAKDAALPVTLAQLPTSALAAKAPSSTTEEHVLPHAPKTPSLLQEAVWTATPIALGALAQQPHASTVFQGPTDLRRDATPAAHCLTTLTSHPLHAKNATPTVKHAQAQASVLPALTTRTQWVDYVLPAADPTVLNAKGPPALGVLPTTSGMVKAANSSAHQARLHPMACVFAHRVSS